MIVIIFYMRKADYNKRGMIMNKLDACRPSVLRTWLKYYDSDDINEDVPECTLFDYLRRSNEAYPDDVALSYFDNDITFGELFDRIRKTAGAYRAIGVRAGDVVTICSVTTPEIVYTFYALNLIGAVANMVDPRTSSEGIREYIEESESRYVCVLNKAYPKISDAISGTGVAAVVVVSPADSLVFLQSVVYRLFNRDGNQYSPICVGWDSFIEKGSDTPPEPARYSREHCAAIVHTGGTTGSPKGVMPSMTRS
ncbi:MAG: long-chain fatty acid--CoA ligase [Clostridia bacterium]|nr:long-chain fatty acid--CoA ligase [Clostridia bacterium]